MLYLQCSLLLHASCFISFSHTKHSPIHSTHLDPYRGKGTTYLHGNTVAQNCNTDINATRKNNPTGAVVVPISLSTTFQQDTPGQPAAIDDPNSFGMGYEYSRTGKG